MSWACKLFVSRLLFGTVRQGRLAHARHAVLPDEIAARSAACLTAARPQQLHNNAAQQCSAIRKIALQVDGNNSPLRKRQMSNEFVTANSRARRTSLPADGATIAAPVQPWGVPAANSSLRPVTEDANRRDNCTGRYCAEFVPGTGAKRC